MWTDLENVAKWKTQIQKVTYYMIPFKLNILSRQIQRQKQAGGCQALRGREQAERLARGCISPQGCGKWLVEGGGCTHRERTQCR